MSGFLNIWCTSRNSWFLVDWMILKHLKIAFVSKEVVFVFFLCENGSDESPITGASWILSLVIFATRQAFFDILCFWFSWKLSRVCFAVSVKVPVNHASSSYFNTVANCRVCALWYFCATFSKPVFLPQKFFKTRYFSAKKIQDPVSFYTTRSSR